MIGRRKLLGTIAAGAGAAVLSGCDALTQAPGVRKLLTGSETLHLKSQRLITDRTALAQEFTRADMSPVFRANGSMGVATPQYAEWRADGFASWRLLVSGLVARPLSLSLAQIMALPQRRQITRHDCVEGWSAIGQWQGPQLGGILRAVGLSARARYIVLRCADDFSGTAYYESIDLVDAFHPQTILAWAMNGKRLDEPHGAPLRLRVERQLGYKHAKFLTGIEAVASLDGIGAGKGGYWEDVGDYAWYAGI